MNWNKKGLLVWGVFWAQSLSAQITGVVVSQSGSPIPNALVYDALHVDVFTKTDVDGNFMLPVTNRAISVAALGYTPQYNLSVPANANMQVQLPQDTLLQTDEFHIDFEHLRPGNNYSKEELLKDLPVSYGKGFYDPQDPGSNRAAVDATQSVSGKGRSLKVIFPAGKLKTNDSGVDTRIALEGTINNNTFAANDLYFSYWIRFSENFEFDKCGGKLPSLGGSDFNTRENQWKGRIMWRHGGSIQFYMELPHDQPGLPDSLRFWGTELEDHGDICTDIFTPYLQDKTKWHNIELHYKLNDPGMENGVFEGWVNGNHAYLDAKYFNQYRPLDGSTDELTINAILLSAFLGGSDSLYEPTQDTWIWLDEFRVSRSRIRDYERFGQEGSLPVMLRNEESRGNLPQNRTVQYPSVLFNEFDALGRKTGVY
jgi:hypothetical protein